MTDYEKSFLAKDTVNSLNKYIERLKEIRKAAEEAEEKKDTETRMSQKKLTAQRAYNAVSSWRRGADGYGYSEQQFSVHWPVGKSVLKQQPKTVKAAQENLVSFQEILQNKSQEQNVSGTQDLKFSKHAAVRLENRGIELTDAQLERLNGGARKAGQKGIRDSLVIVDDLAFIVNVPNKTVVTAMNSRETEENVFTNINGAVIM